MRETLYIQLRVPEAGAPTPYCIARSDAVASFAVDQAPLDQLIQHAVGRRLVVLVPSSDVRLTTVQLPARQMAKVLQAVPYALEDQLADDIETLHFALGARLHDGSWPVAVVARARMMQWLAIFAEHGLRPDALIPDVLALPVPDSAHVSMLIDGDDVVVRSGAGAGFVCQREDLSLCLEMFDPERTRTLRTVIPRDQAFDPSTLPWPQEPLHGFAHPLEALLHSLHAAPYIDLLQGEYSPQQDWLRLWRPWRLVAGLALAAFVLAGTVYGVSAARLGAELDALRAENQRRYQEIFPTETRIVDLAAQLEQQFTRLEGGSSSASLLSLMDIVGTASGEVPGLTVQTVQFRDRSLYVGFTAQNLQSLEQLKAWFETPRAARMEVQSANSGSQGVQIRIKLVPA